MCWSATIAPLELKRVSSRNYNFKTTQDLVNPEKTLEAIKIHESGLKLLSSKTLKLNRVYLLFDMTVGNRSRVLFWH